MKEGERPGGSSECAFGELCAEFCVLRMRRDREKGGDDEKGRDREKRREKKKGRDREQRHGHEKGRDAWACPREGA